MDGTEDEGIGGQQSTGHAVWDSSFPSPLLTSTPLYLLALAGGHVTSRRESRSFCRCFIIIFLASVDPLEVRLQLGTLPAPSKVL